MRRYAAAEREAQRARDLLMQWKQEGLLSQEQYQRLETGTISDLRTANIFLRLVLLLFTLIAVAATVALFFTLTDIPSSGVTAGLYLLVFSVYSPRIMRCVASPLRARSCHFGCGIALISGMPFLPPWSSQHLFPRTGRHPTWCSVAYSASCMQAGSPF